MYPELFHVGFIHIRSYGLMMAVAFVVGTFLALRESRRLSLDEDKVVNVILVTLVASVLGARRDYVLEHLPEFRREWTSARALWLGTMFGRIGCFLNGCCYGRPTGLPWGVVFPHDSFATLEFGNQPVHPSQLYNALAGLGLFAIFQSLRGRFRVPGVMFWTFIAAFALIRIPLDLTRAYETDAVLMRVGVTDITESQLMSMVMILFAGLMILRLRRAAPRPAPAPAATTP